MKRKGKTFALAIALAVLVAAWLLAEFMAGRLQKEPEEKVSAQPIVLAAGTKADIQALSWRYGEQTVELIWDDGRGAWVNGEDYACPIDQTAVEPLVEAASGVNALMAIHGETDFAQYGLETPILSLTVTTADNAVCYDLGNQTLTGEYYLRVDGTDTVYTETGLLMPAFQVVLEDLLAMESGPDDIAAVMMLSVNTDVTDYEVVYREETEDTWYGEAYDWSALVDGNESMSLEIGQAEALYELVTGIKFVSCVDWHGEGLAEYGLEHPQGTAAVTYRTEENKTKTFALEFGNYEKGCVYVRIAGTDVVYLAEGAVLDGLMYPEWEAMTPWAVCPVTVTEMTGAEVKLGGHVYDIERYVEEKEAVDENGDLITEEMVYYVSNGWTLDTDAAEAWFGSLGDLEAESFAGEAQGREEQLSVMFRRDSENWPEVTITLWSYDSARYLCTVNGEDSWFIARGDGEALVTQGEMLLVIE